MSIIRSPEFAAVPLYTSETFTTVADHQDIARLTDIQTFALHSLTKDIPQPDGSTNPQYYASWHWAKERSFRVTYTPTTGMTRLAKQAPYGHKQRNQIEELVVHQGAAEGLGFGSPPYIAVAWKASQSLFDGVARRIELPRGEANTADQPDLEKMYQEAESRDHTNRRLAVLLTEFTETMPSLRVRRMRCTARKLGKSLLHSFDFGYLYPR